MNGLSNKYLDQIMRKCSASYYQGVYAANNLPRHIFLSADKVAVICNLSPIEQTKGSHFIVIMRNKSKLWLFDSLALPNTSLPKSIVNTMKETGLEIKYGCSKPIQNVLSHFCGFYCLFFILLHDESCQANAKKIMAFHENPSLENDQICVRNIEILLK